MLIIFIFVTGNIAKELNLRFMSDVNLRILVERPDKFKAGSFKVIFGRHYLLMLPCLFLLVIYIEVYDCCFRTMMQSFIS